jgi:acyl-CoA thioesterase YciA
MNFKTRKLVSPPDLNPAGTLFGGKLLSWIDEEVAIFAMCQLDSNFVVTKFMSEINFIKPAYKGDIVEIGCEVISMGRTSITLSCLVRVKDTDTIIIQIDKIVFVHVDQNGRPKPHNKSMNEVNSNV